MEQTQGILELLGKEKIDYEFTAHRAAYTIEEMLRLNLPRAEEVAKNLFIRDHKKRDYYLLVVRQDIRADLKALRRQIGSRQLCLAHEEELNRILHLAKGSVTPFGILNDESRMVKVLIDAWFRGKRIGVHPNENTATVWLETDALFGLLQRHGNEVSWIEL